MHAAVACASPADPCLAAACDPVTGCTIVPVADGTTCGDNDCVTARVCMAGACVQRSAPEGSRCAAPTLCRAEGRCVQGSCEQSTGTPTPRWRYQPPAGSFIGRAAVDPQGNAYVFVSDDVRTQYDAGAPYQLRLVSLDPSGAQRWVVNLSTANVGLENGTQLVVDAAANRLYLSARTYNYGTEVMRASVAQAREASTGALVWERDLIPGIPVSNPGSDGRVRIDVQKLMLLNTGDVALTVVEGDSLHQAYVVALAKATGAQLWRVHRDGHATMGATASGEVWDVSAACWSQVSYLAHVGPTGIELGRWQASQQLYAFGGDEVVVRGDGGLALLKTDLTQRELPLLPGQTLLYDPAVRLDHDRVTSVSLGGGVFQVTRYDVATATFEWSVPLPLGSNHAQLRLLEGGGVLANTSQIDGGSALYRLAANGVEVERCALPSPIAVEAGQYFTVGRSLDVYAAPGLAQQPYGWPAADGVGGTSSARF
ncbi:MAG: hypothetical protein JNK82_30100 [Myxococcaceae bacterium]|nr:hypothetical protein [Myxococcaceae bacterium]